ncbi:amidase signature domain-containing protein [Clohesyomyces aquaticus]|uniref:amidase n=1 Tax=Clohesyomyces aquaticus TaxID=1231657 RepID=A0A1Y1YEY8_9PLEO|nr:amidase signature domain-containing protein [Clohesyomyces aquaticus]
MSRTNKPPKRPWQAIAQEAQTHRDTTIASLSPPLPPIPSPLPPNVLSLPSTFLTPETLKITSLHIESLLPLLLSGTLTATAVTTAYLHRAALSQALTNCLTELLPQRALARATELDAYYATHNRPIGPLHGLPISVKEHIGMAGLRNTAGYVSFWNKIAQEDAHILQILASAGAVFHCRTTIPQTMMHLECSSNLYGVTVNPYNSSLSSGGSSGGEGALLALHGSCLGIGSDVGGSIRSPAANCGVYGLKPTAFRVPTDGWGYMMAGADSVESVLGPMGTSLPALSLFMKTVLDTEPWVTEPALIPLPWREYKIPEDKEKERKLKVGIMWHDGVVQPHPPITRALREMKESLEGAGIEVLDFPCHAHDEAWAILASLYFTDGGREDADAIDSSDEPWRPLSTWILKENPCVKALTVGELIYWLEEREHYRKEYASHWNKTGVDVVLCPVGPGVAPKHDTAKYWGYTSLWNLLDYPGCVFPVSKVDKEVDVKVEKRGFKALSGKDEENWGLYDKDAFHGLPVSLQLVGRRFDDEKVLGIAEYIGKKCGLPFEPFP